MFPCIKLKRLQELLEDLDDFKKPKIHLEQYVTPPHLSSHVMYTIQSQYGDLENKLVADLGAGCGALSVAASLLNAAFVVGFEIDEDPLRIFQKNVDFYQLANIELLNIDVLKIPQTFFGKFDTVITNPPFGTKNNSGTDVNFLKVALQLTNGTVYSLHKTSTRKYILGMAEKFGAKAEVLAELKYDIGRTYKFHKKCNVDVEVDLYKFSKIQ